MRLMRSAGLLWLLTLLLAFTTPVTGGQGPHRDQTLDVLFPHQHPGHEDIGAASTPQSTRGPVALGAGGPADGVTFGLWSPTLPDAVAVSDRGDDIRWVQVTVRRPSEWNAPAASPPPRLAT